jgi:flavin reductase (DIM6/NTAB) family NADH-FMN oxidoreductase RutF
MFLILDGNAPMLFDFSELTPSARYELLLGTIVPRPIAIITTLSEARVLNAAPYSLFAVVSHDPPILMVSVLPHAERRLKDTAENAFATREFVVNLVSRSLAEAMNVTCVDAPPEIDELELAQLKTAPSRTVGPPRIALSPVAFECRFLTSLSFGPDQATLFGRVSCVHVADEYVSNAENGVIDTPRLELIGGMHGARWYTGTSDLFAMDRPTWAGWPRDSS